MIAFETGRIRPPSEAQSILLRITRSCHWNRCAFCPVYKHEPYSIRKADEIKRDIDAMAAVADRVRRRMDGACGAGPDRAKAANAVTGLDRDEAVDADCFRLMAFWMLHGLRSVFLQDADALVLRTGQLVEILNRRHGAGNHGNRGELRLTRAMCEAAPSSFVEGGGDLLADRFVVAPVVVEERDWAVDNRAGGDRGPVGLGGQTQAQHV